tara:strand:+ start:43 stop:159 length:117 start_codon:yes stop_codon:yes gene_type:complete
VVVFGVVLFTQQYDLLLSGLGKQRWCVHGTACLPPLPG